MNHMTYILKNVEIFLKIKKKSSMIINLFDMNMYYQPLLNAFPLLFFQFKNRKVTNFNLKAIL